MQWSGNWYELNHLVAAQWRLLSLSQLLQQWMLRWGYKLLQSVSKAASVCDLPLLELYWFHALRQPLGSGVSPSTDLPSGTVCHQHYVRRICRRTPSSGHWRRISSHPSSDTESFRDFAAAYKFADLLTNLLKTMWDNSLPLARWMRLPGTIKVRDLHLWPPTCTFR